MQAEVQIERYFDMIQAKWLIPLTILVLVDGLGPKCTVNSRGVGPAGESSLELSPEKRPSADASASSM